MRRRFDGGGWARWEPLACEDGEDRGSLFCDMTVLKDPNMACRRRVECPSVGTEVIVHVAGTNFDSKTVRWQSGAKERDKGGNAVRTKAV